MTEGSPQMRAQASGRDSRPELRLRRELHRRGLRYRVQRNVLPDVRRRHDIVFGPARIVVEVRGCYWHGCPLHFRAPTGATAEWWLAKIQRNRRRDRDTAQRLAQRGWMLIEVWEHDDVTEAAERIESAARTRRARSRAARR